jgi:chlorobactene glucosyltransferase
VTVGDEQHLARDGCRRVLHEQEPRHAKDIDAVRIMRAGLVSGERSKHGVGIVVRYTRSMVWQDAIGMVLSALALAGGAFWAIVAFRIWKDLPFTRPVADGLDLALDGPGPMVSVIVPAHNEQGKAAHCARSILAGDWPSIEVIFVLDRCTDGTLDELREVAAVDPRLVIIENGSCPEDWAGKCNAARIGAERARGELLLFTDADTWFDPRLVRASVGLLRVRRLGLLSLLSTLTRKLPFERHVQPVAALQLMKRYPLGRANRAQRPKPFANGQFMLFERSVYEGLGGHAAVKHALLEDLAFAWAVHRAGSRTGVFVADGMLVTSMYDSWEQFAEGWKRIYIEAYGRSVIALRRAALGLIAVGIVAPTASVTCLGYGALGALSGWPRWGWPIGVGAGTLAMMLGTLTWIHWRMRAPRWGVMRHAESAWLVAGILRSGARDLASRRAVRWGGRAYVLESREDRRARQAREAATTVGSVAR